MILRFILGDQLNAAVSSLQDIDPQQDQVLMCEVLEEAQYIRHHKKKIAFIFSAMRHFAQALRDKGYRVTYIKLDDKHNTGSFTGEIERAVKQFNPSKVVITEPSEYRVLHAIKKWHLGVPVEVREDNRFLCSHKAFKAWADGRKQLRMEYFYREMRKHYQVLMDGDKPEGGEWNYDTSNRKPPKQGLQIPTHYQSQTDETTNEVIKLVAERFANHFGDLEPFHLAVTRSQALYALHKFIDERLNQFGDYQDAMVQGEPWMFHSHLSFYINCGLLLPLECIKAAEQAYRIGKAPLNAAEGFIRQILGWREYVRGVYWLNMPTYQQANYLNAKRSLPGLFWRKPTRMNCLKQCVEETWQNAYAHHIQRLMVLGNFCLLAGINPTEVNEWYWIVYADAYQWVELPNVTGMILFADGGQLGSKPYAASGAYINKMSDYCKNCHYKVNQKNGEDACPFNYLYWDFLRRNQKQLEGNPRLSMAYKTLNNMKNDKHQAIEEDCKAFFNALDENKGI